MTLDGDVNHLCLPIALNNSEILEKPLIVALNSIRRVLRVQDFLYLHDIIRKTNSTRLALRRNVFTGFRDQTERYVNWCFRQQIVPGTLLSFAIF